MSSLPPRRFALEKQLSMKSDVRTVHRKTGETDISLSLDMRSDGKRDIRLGLPFFEHMLTAMSFHGSFHLVVEASGDLEVDPHHMVEDVGLVMGEALRKSTDSGDAISRFGHAVIPMDDALSEVTIDACGRAFLDYRADFPQSTLGSFDVALVREFLLALANCAMFNMHASCRRGVNSHHMVESLFKALGKALKQAYSPAGPLVRSTKGTLG